MKATSAALLGLALLLSGCFSTLDATTEQVEAEFSSALKPGAPSPEIEAYFQSRSLGFSYDQFSNRYQSIIRHPDSNFHAITIHVLLDQQKRYVSVDAEDSYTLW